MLLDLFHFILDATIFFFRASLEKETTIGTWYVYFYESSEHYLYYYLREIYTKFGISIENPIHIHYLK